MHIPVLIEPVNNNGYRVTSGPPVSMTAEGATREEALQRLQQALQDRLRAGAELSTLEIAGPGHPIAAYAGMFKDNPLFDAWQQAIADYRRQEDEDTEAP